MNTTKDKNIHAQHRERMKKQFLENGFDSFSDIEKVEFLLFFADSNGNLPMSQAYALLTLYFKRAVIQINP